MLESISSPKQKIFSVNRSKLNVGVDIDTKVYFYYSGSSKKVALVLIHNGKGSSYTILTKWP